MANYKQIPREDRINLYKICVANSDIGEALLTTRLFLSTVKDLRNENYQPLQDAIIVAYSRPFTNNRPFGVLDNKWAVFEDPRLEKLHCQIIETRDTLVAHSDGVYRKVKVVPKGTTQIKGIPENKDTAITVSRRWFTLETFPEIERLCLYVGGRLNDEMFKETERLFGNKELPGKPFDLIDFGE